MIDQLAGSTVLVTGAAGFIGRRVVARLAQVPGVRTVALTRTLHSAQQQDGVIRVGVPLRQLTSEVWAVHGIDRLDFVLHLAGYVRKSAADRPTLDMVLEDSILGTRALLMSMPVAPKRFAFASSLDVYAPPRPGERLSESSPLAPKSLYAASKLFLEALVREHGVELGNEVTVLRIGHVYGPGEEAFHRLIPVTLQRLLRGESAVLTGDPEVERDYIYVDDAAELALRALVTSPLLDVVNIVRGESITVRELLSILISVVGGNARIERQTGGPPAHSLRFDASRTRRLLGDTQLVTMRDGLVRECAYLRLRGTPGR